MSNREGWGLVRIMLSFISCLDEAGIDGLFFIKKTSLVRFAQITGSLLNGNVMHSTCKWICLFFVFTLSDINK